MTGAEQSIAVEPARASRAGVPTLLALTFVTGIVDAVAFLAFGHVFAAMQTGNVIFLGFGLAGAGDVAVAASLVALACFVVGGAAVAAVVSAGRGLTLRGAMALEALVLAGAALGVAAVEPGEGEAAAYAVVGVLALAMGLRNTVARHESNPNFATTVLNLTLTSGTTGPASRADLRDRALAVVAILLGAVVGALLLRTDPALALAAAAAVTLGALVASGSGRVR